MTEIVRQLTHKGVEHDFSKPTLRCEHVHVAYVEGSSGATTTRGGDAALTDVNFELTRGERIAVVGPNGAGKSTLFKLIVGAIQPTSGTIEIFGHGPDGHICIGYVPQRSQIDWTFPVTVADVVMMGRVGQIGLFRWPRKQDWARVYAALERVNAAHLAKKQIGELSGGQQQRVFIARALAQEAELLLLDEPLTGLDIPSQEAILQILTSLKPDGVTVLVATHDLDLATRHFDRVMLLNRRVVAFGKPEDALTTENLLRAYGGHMHVMPDADSAMFLADDCCGGGQEMA